MTLSDILALFTSPETVFPAFLTLKTCAVSLAGFFFLAVPLAYVLARKNNLLTRSILFISTIPLIFPPVALGYILLLLLGRHGFLGIWLENAFSFRLIFSETGVFLAAFLAGLPLVLRPVKTAFESAVIRRQEDVASTLGARPRSVFFRVTLPLAAKSIWTGVLLGVARASGEVGITMMLGGNIEGRTNTLSLEIFNAVGRGDFDVATALCLLLGAIALFIFGLSSFFQKKEPSEA